MQANNFNAKRFELKRIIVFEFAYTQTEDSVLFNVYLCRFSSKMFALYKHGERYWYKLINKHTWNLI